MERHHSMSPQQLQRCQLSTHVAMKKKTWRRRRRRTRKKVESPPPTHLHSFIPLSSLSLHLLCSFILSSLQLHSLLTIAQMIWFLLSLPCVLTQKMCEVETSVTSSPSSAVNNNLLTVSFGKKVVFLSLSLSNTVTLFFPNQQIKYKFHAFWIGSHD